MSDGKKSGDSVSEMPTPQSCKSMYAVRVFSVFVSCTSLIYMQYMYDAKLYDVCKHSTRLHSIECIFRIDASVLAFTLRIAFVFRPNFKIPCVKCNFVSFYSAQCQWIRVSMCGGGGGNCMYMCLLFVQRANA